MAAGGRFAWLIGCAIAVTVVAPEAAGQCQYDLTEMERISCGFFSVGGSPRGMNEQGVAVGQHLTCGGSIMEAFVWVPGEDVEFLPRPAPFNEASANDVNCHHQIVGWLGNDGLPFNGAMTRTAALWDDGAPVELPMPDYANWSEAFAINDAGVIAGQAMDNVTGPIHGVVWHDGGMTDLGPLLGTPLSSAEGLNEQGDIVGWMGTGFSDAHAYVISGGVVTDLGVVPDGSTGLGKDINERGDVILD